MELFDHVNKRSRVDDTSSKRSSEMVVLQPSGALLGEAGLMFQSDLEQAIVDGTAVIVDLLWVDRVDEQGIAILIAGMKRAQLSGKSLVFLAMDGATRTALDAIWEQQRAAEAPLQADWFRPDFEQFLDNYKSANL